MSLSPSLRDFQNLSPQAWVDHASRTIPRLLVVVLVIAIAWQLVQLTWLMLDRNDASVPVAVTASPAVSGTRKGVDVQAIANAHLFGTARVAAPTDAASAPQTQMNLVLAGTWAVEDPEQGFAFIGESANTARMYAVGKVVRGSTTLHAVYEDRIVLDTNGKLETLTLPRLSAGSGAIASTAAPRRAPQNQFTDNLRRVAESNPSAFAEIVRPQPVFANGVQRGYRVYPGRQRQQFTKLGLRPGDLVLAVNGTPLDDPQRGMEIFGTIGDADRVTVTIERSGQSQELTLNTAQIQLPDGGAPAQAVGNGRPAALPSPASPPTNPPEE